MRARSLADGMVSDQRLTSLLFQTSRTFAVCVPLLPDELRREVTVAYLLLRIADTVEDATSLSKSQKLDALSDFGELLAPDGKADQDRLVGRLTEEPPCDDPHHMELIRELPSVVHTLRGLDPDDSAVIRDSVIQSISGMRRFLSAGDMSGNVRLKSLAEVRDYCYCVAGLVGEMLTSLFVRKSPGLVCAASDLHAGARFFGEGLQLVNILKDSDEDELEGRIFVPRGMRRVSLFELARSDLAVAERYVHTMKSCTTSPGIVAFCELPLRLAWRTLKRVEESGPGSKVSRAEVAEMVFEVTGGELHLHDGSRQDAAADRLPASGEVFT